MGNYDWNQELNSSSPTEQVENFQAIIESKLNTIFPTKKIRISSSDKPYITSELKKLDRKKKKEYRKKGKSEKYVKLRNEFEFKLKKAGKKYISKNVTGLIMENPAKAYSILKRMGAQPGDCQDEGSFHLQNHLDANMSPEDCTESIANHFSKISQEYAALNEAELPTRVQEKLKQPISNKDLPKITKKQVLEKITKANKPKSVLPGDVPKTLINECKEGLSTPLYLIFQNMLKTYQWPKQWRLEYGVPLKKVSNPLNEDDLRIISLTSFSSKVYEGFVMDWLMKYVGHKIDWAQYGGLRGNSISNYLIELTNFVLYNQDLKNPQAVLAMMADFSKAYNRVSHNILIEILSDMGVPNWLLKIVMAFLSERELILRYKGKSSSQKALPGGTPQGTRLGMFLFLILINWAGFDESELEKKIGQKITQPFSKRKPIEKAHMKFIDDLTLVHAIDLKKCLKQNKANIPRPVPYHSRTGHLLPESENIMQIQANKLQEYVTKNNMKINQSKSKLMLFNTSRKYDFLPEVTFDGENKLEVVDKIKLLGIFFQSDMRWYSNTNNLCKNGYSRLWMIRNLKKYGAGKKELLDVYMKQCRSVLELAVPVWNAGLSAYEVKQLERVQKTAFSIILGKDYISYEQALLDLEMETLEVRRSKNCLAFAKKSQKHEKFRNWFEFSDRTSKPSFLPVTFRTKRYKKSPLPYLTELLNKQ